MKGISGVRKSILLSKLWILTHFPMDRIEFRIVSDTFGPIETAFDYFVQFWTSPIVGTLDLGGQFLTNFTAFNNFGQFWSIPDNFVQLQEDNNYLGKFLYLFESFRQFWTMLYIFRLLGPISNGFWQFCKMLDVFGRFLVAKY